MTRFLTDHKVNPANTDLHIAVTDVAGAGGANHRYEIYGFDAHTNPSATPGLHDMRRLVIPFQNGAIPEVGVNGVTIEALLAIAADRLRSFQAGPFACWENALALTKLEDAMHQLHARTLGRIARGVEGTHQK